MNKIILIGNPNVGKTTLYNTLTSSNEKATNWHGVTVDCKSKKYLFNGEKFEVCDLPGIYSLEGYSNEEKIAIDYLNKNRDGLIINICDANNLKRNIKLTLDLIKNSYNVLLAINMINDYYEFDSKMLSDILEIDVIGIDARNKNSVNVLKTAIFDKIHKNNIKNTSNFTKNAINCKKLDAYFDKLNQYKKIDYTSKIDKVVLNKFVFLPLFVFSMFFVFYLTFGLFGDFCAKIFNHFLDTLFNFFSNFIMHINTSIFVKEFFIKAVLSSIKIVLSFLPQIVILILLFNVLEDIGIMSRFAFMLDGLMKKIGLTGKSLFSIMMGYGCTVSAVLTTRNLENKRLRNRTILLLPFSTCSAKLPVLLMISSIFFDSYKYLFVLFLYLFSIIISLICASIYSRILPDKSTIFVLELPRYRLPNLNKILKEATSVIFEFIVKIGTTILIFSIFFWILQNFSLNFKFLNGENYNNSILFFVSKFLSPVFKPIGLDNPAIVSVMLFGLIAKELIVVGLMFVNNIFSIELLKASLISHNSLCHFNINSAIIFLIFILLYSPCISALATIKNEVGKKMAAFVFIAQFIISYLFCFLVKHSLENNFILLIVIILISLAFAIKYVIKYNWRNKCGGNCYACGKF